MAITTIYAGTTSAGAADGSTYADRIALLSGGNLSTTITGHDFSASALTVLVDSGTYTITQNTTSSIYTTATPTAQNVLRIFAAPSGILWTPPTADWTAARPIWDTSTMPVFDYGASNYFGNSPHTIVQGICVTGATTSTVSATINSGSPTASINWCKIINTASNANSQACYRPANAFSHCVIECSGTAYNAVLRQIGERPDMDQVRIQGNPSASSGSRLGITDSSGSANKTLASALVHGVTSTLLDWTTTSVGSYYDIRKCVFVGNGSNGGITHSSVVSTPTARDFIKKTIFANLSTAANLNLYSTELLRTILANNTTDVSGTNVDLSNSFDTTDALTDIFVDPSNADYTQRDFRIKNTYTYWGYNIGIEDQAAAAAGGTSTNMRGGFIN